MPYDGLGNFDRIHNWTDDADAGILIRSDRFDQENDDFAAGFGDCLTRDGQGKPTDDISWNNKKITDLDDPNTLLGAMNMKTAQNSEYKFIDTTGSGNAYLASLVPTISGLVDGMFFYIRANHANTGASTLDLNAAGAKALQVDGKALAGGELQIGQIYGVSYDSGGDVFELHRTSFATSAETIAGLITTKPVTPSGVNALLANSVLLFGGINGLNTENDSGDLLHDIKVNSGGCTDSTNSVIMDFSGSTIIKKIDANWVEGTNQGGFPSGLSLSAGTWYHFFLISKTDDTIDAGFDTSLSAANLLSDASAYTYFRRIGSILTDGSSDITPYTQNGDIFLWKTVRSEYLVTNPGTSAVLRPLAVPLGLKVLVLHAFKITDTSPAAANAVLVTSPEQTDSIPSANLSDIRTAGGAGTDMGSVYKEILTNTATQIRTRQATSDAGQQIGGTTFGWRDFRGKENL